MKYYFTINETLPNLNDLISCERVRFKTSRGGFATKGNVLKKKWQKVVVGYIRRDLGNLKITKPVIVHYKFVEGSARRDVDNIAAFALKITHDALQEAGTIQNDNQKYVRGFTCDFEVDKANPHIEVCIEECEVDNNTRSTK